MPENDRIIGVHSAKIENLEARMGRMDDKLDTILATLNEAKGGWRLLMLIGGGAAAIASAVTAILVKLYIK